MAWRAGWKGKSANGELTNKVRYVWGKERENVPAAVTSTTAVSSTSTTAVSSAAIAVGSIRVTTTAAARAAAITSSTVGRHVDLIRVRKLCVGATSLSMRVGGGVSCESATESEGMDGLFEKADA